MKCHYNLIDTEQVGKEKLCCKTPGFSDNDVAYHQALKTIFINTISIFSDFHLFQTLYNMHIFCNKVYRTIVSWKKTSAFWVSDLEMEILPFMMFLLWKEMNLTFWEL